MNTWALLKEGRIVNTVTSVSGKGVVQKMFPEYEVADIYSLPPNVQEAYQYWNERP